jgi:predicted nucleotidyltransferase component of viral defense system
MIPRDFITEWRSRAPWVQDLQVEQDLVISRALVEIFSRPKIAAALAFRGGAALYKLHVQPAARYSEDIDLVQTRAEPIGETIDELRNALDSWLGPPQRRLKEGRVTLLYHFTSEDSPPVPLKLKLEINSNEHFTVFGLVKRPFAIVSRWFSGRANITTYTVDELLGTKVRALYQRKKGRDLFDLDLALEETAADPARVVEAFTKYMAAEHQRVTRAVFEQNLAAKLGDPRFAADMSALLAQGRTWDLPEAAKRVSAALIARLPGGAAKSSKPRR